jgi:hypothetical protein
MTSGPLRVVPAELLAQANGVQTARSNALRYSVACLVLGILNVQLAARPSFTPVLWAATVLLLLFNSGQLATFLFPGESWLINFLVVGMLFHVLASVLVIILGIFGILSGASQVAALVLVSLLVVQCSARSRVATCEFGVERKVMYLDPILFSTLLAVLFASAIILLNQLRYTVSDSDSMWYHLPMVAEWIRSGSIWPAETIPLLARAYPGFRESVLTFLSLPMHNEHLALLGFLELPMFALTIFSLSYYNDTSPRLAAAAAAYASTVPVVATAFGTQGNDLSLAIFFNLSVLFVWKLGEKPTMRQSVAAGLALGALAATKFSGLIYVVIIFIIVAIWALFTRVTKFFKIYLALLLTMAAVGGIWYLRNMIAYGNPIYPAQITIGGRILFDGPLTREFFSATTLGWNVWPLVKNYAHFVEAFGILIPLVFVNIFFLPIIEGFKKRLNRGSFCLSILALLCFLVFLHQPFNIPAFGYSYNMRYLLPWFSISLVGLTAAVANIAWASNVTTGLLLFGSVMNMYMWTQWWWLLLIVFIAIVPGYAIACSRNATFYVPESLSFAVRFAGMAIFVVLALWVGHLKAKLQYDPDYGYKDSSGDRGWGAICAYVHKNLTGQRISVHGDNNFFPLYGDDLSNKIFLIQQTLSPAEIVSYARSKEADYLVAFVPNTGRLGMNAYLFGESVAPSLLTAYPQYFSIVFHDRGAYLLRLHPPRK